MRNQDVTVLPNALKEWRKVRGISQKELADMAGCSAGLIALIETSERQPGLRNALNIAKALGVPVTAFAQIHVDLAGEVA